MHSKYPQAFRYLIFTPLHVMVQERFCLSTQHISRYKSEAEWSRDYHYIPMCIVWGYRCRTICESNSKFSLKTSMVYNFRRMDCCRYDDPIFGLQGEEFCGSYYWWVCICSCIVVVLFSRPPSYLPLDPLRA